MTTLKTLSLVAALCAAVAYGQDPLLASTEHGLLRGKYNQGYLPQIVAHLRDTSKLSRVWASIPFAQAPTGRLRFRSPVPWTGKWDDTRDATSYPPPCPQNFFTTKAQSEDCLFLNVFTPSEKRMKEAGRPLPVLVWIFGGAFYLGDSYMTGAYNPRTVTDHTDAIVVTFNYRLGALGFFDTNDSHSNLAIEDQRLALQWVKRNIDAFGGDSAKILIYGLSAGATSTAVHLTSPLTEPGLFSRVIHQSGPLGARMRLRQDVISESKKLADRLHCLKNNKVDLACMQDKPVHDILQASRQYMNDPSKRPETANQRPFFEPTAEQLRASADAAALTGDASDDNANGSWAHADDNKVAHELGDQYIWWPYIDDKNIVGQPLDMIRDGQYPKDVAVILGVQRSEAAYWMRTYDKPVRGAKAERLALNVTAHTVHMRNTFGKDLQRVQELYPIHDSTQENKMEMIRLGTDYVFTCPTEQAAMSMDKHRTRQLYVYEWTLPAFPPLGICTKLACHSNDLPFMFRTLWPLIGERKVLQRQVMAYWTNFAATGDPNRRLDGKLDRGTDKFKLAHWPRYNAATQERLELGEELQTLGPIRPKHCKLWNDELGYNFDDVSDSAKGIDEDQVRAQLKAVYQS